MKRRHFFGKVGITALLAATAKIPDSLALGNGRGKSKIDQKLGKMGIELPNAPAPLAAYSPFRKVGNLVYVAGQGPIDSPDHQVRGRVGKDMTIEQGYYAARTTAYNILAQLKKACDGNLDRVVQCVQLHGIVQCTDDFKDSPKVINGTTELFRELWGDAGLPARAAVGTNALPGNISVEVLSVFEIRA